MADDSSLSTRLQNIWDIFFHAETGTYQKSLWLDLLLAEFLIQLKEGTDISQILSFCPLGGVTTLIGCELLCGIHCVTSVYGHCAKKSDCIANCESTHFPPSLAYDRDVEIPKEEITFCENLQRASNFPALSHVDQSLHKYVLKGAAWRCLALLQILGVKGLSCRRQLSRTLIWLYGELCGVTSASCEPNPFLSPFESKRSIHELFSNKIWSQRKNFMFNALYSKDNATLKRNKKTTNGTLSARKKYQRASRSKTKEGTSKKLQKNLSHSSDSQDFDDLERMNRSFALKLKRNQTDIDCFTSAAYTDGEIVDSKRNCPYANASGDKKSIKRFMTDKHTQILNSEISVYEFDMLVIDLLYQLCAAEADASGSEALPINVQCITFTIKHLCTLQFESSPATGSSTDSDRVASLKASLTELLMISLNKVLMHPDLFGKVISNGMLPMLLRLLEDITYKSNVQLNAEDESSVSQFKDKTHFANRTLKNPEVNHLLKYLFGVTYSILIFLYSLMMQRRSINDLKDFTEQFKLFGDCKKGLLINESINIMLRLPGIDKGYVPLLVKKIIVLLGRFIIAMKQVRCAVTHLANCPRMKHKWCYSKLIVTLHHHRDVLGANCPSNQNTILSSGCCVATLYGVLTSLLADDRYTSNAMLLTKLLKCMINSGSCCCFSPQFLIGKVINAIVAHPSVSNLCFAVLEHTLYGELGAIEYEFDDSNCTVCKRYFNAVNKISSDSSTQESSLTRYMKYKIVWPFLTKYNTLLYYEDRLLVTATMNHLLKMSSNSNDVVRHDLLFCVLYPVFISAKDQYVSKNNDSSYFVTLSCLNLFSSLLSTVVFMEEFIQKGGLLTVLDLITVEDFFKPCCTLLEIAVNIEIFQFEQEYCHDDESLAIEVARLQSLTSFQILFKTLDGAIDDALKYFASKMDPDAFLSITDMSNILAGVPLKNKGFFKKNFSSYVKKTYPININRPSLSRDDSVRMFSTTSSENDSVDNRLEEITKMAIYWKTIASLCLYCPLFRKYFCTCTAFEDSYKFLKLVLHNICYATTTEVEKNCMIKILESVVTIGLVLSDCTMGDSKKLTIKLLSEDISLDSLNTIESSNLRLLVEVLFKLSTVNVGDEHILCSIKETKLPIAQTTKNYDDFPSSGDDDDQYYPYISEDSDPYHTADEGYEADVDVCRKLSMKKGLSSSDNNININLSDNFENYEKGNFEKSVANLKHNFVMYPEVCSVGISILMKLIERIIKANEECADIDFDKSVSSLYDVSCTCIATLTSILSSNSNSSSGFGIIKQFFSNPASKILKMKSDRLRKLQFNISELIYTLASQNISAPELKRFVNFFTSTNAPSEVLLKPLEKLASDISQNIPDYILCFPIEKNDEIKISEYTNNSKIKGNSYNRAKSETVLHKQHLNMGIESCWSRAAVWCDIDGVNWSLWMQGCSVALWLRIQDPKSSVNKSAGLRQFNNSEDITESSVSTERQNKFRIFKLNKASEQIKSKTGRDNNNQLAELSSYLHMMSIGHENLIVEFWLDACNGNLRIRICRPEFESNKLVFENEIENFLMKHEWNHLAMNIKEILQNHTIYLQITLFLNGYEKKVVLMPIKGLINRKTKPNFLLLGHSYSGDARDDNKGFWYFSGVDLFRTSLFNKNNITYIFANGPNNSTLYRSQIRSSVPNYANLFNESILIANLDWDLVLNTSSSNMKELEDNILLSYSAHNPLYIELYHQMVSNSIVFGAKVKKSSGFPESQMCTWSGLPLSSLHRGITSAAYLIGGPQVFLYLYARIVEIGGTPEEQSSALSILLKLSFSDSRLYTMFQNDNLFSMLNFVFSMPKCNLTIHTLKVMLDVACSKPIIEKINKQFYLNVKSNAIVFHPHIIIVLLQIWKKLEDTRVVITDENIPKDPQSIINESDQKISLDQMDKTLANNDLLEALFYSMEVVMRDSHIYSTFNVYQLNRVYMLEQLLLFCKERFLNHNMKRLSIVASYSLVELIRSLIGNPPLTHHIALIMDFLVLIHKASETYVTHSRPNFYFLLSPMKPPRSESNASILGMKLPFVSKKRGVRQQRKKKHFGSVNSSDRSFNVSENEATSYADSDNRETKTEGEDSFEMISKDVNNESFSVDVNLPGTSSDPPHSTRIAMNSAKARKLKKDKRNRRIKSNKSLLSNTDTAEERAQTSGHSSPIEGYLIVETDNSGNPSIPGETIPMGPSQSMFHNLNGGSVHSQIVCEGLLLLIRDTVCILPDTLLSQVLGVVLHNETLLILANHEEPSIRAAVVKLIAAIIQRSSLDELKLLEQSHFFYHLANQISQYPASSDLVAACASLVTECRASLQDQLEDEIWNDVSEYSIPRACPLVSLLSCTFHDYPLMRNMIVLLRKIIDKGNTKTLEDISLCEVILKILQKIDFANDAMFRQYQYIYEELYTLLSLVNLKHIVCSSNSQIVADIYNRITFLELTCRRKLNNSHQSQIIIEILRNAQCFVMISELDFMEEKLKFEPYSSILKNIEIISSSYKTSAEKNSRQKQYKLSRSGLQSRYGFILSKALSFLLNKDLTLKMSSHEQSFIKKIFTTLVNFSSDISKRTRQKWHGINDANCLKYFNDLFLWLISPSLSLSSLQLFVLDTIYTVEINLRQLLTPNDPSSQRKIAVYLTLLARNISDKNIRDYIGEWVGNLHQEQYMTAEALTEEAHHLMQQDFENVTQARSQLLLNRCAFSKEPLANKITETAMSLTRTVVETQNIERKAFLDHLRHQQITLVNNAQKWRDMIDRFSHERGIWYFESSYPQSWEVNPIEGPDRVRIRLRRCALDIDERFFHEERKHLSNRTPISKPLSYLFDSFQTNIQSGLLGRSNINESIVYMARATYVTLKCEESGELLLGDRSLHFSSFIENGRNCIISASWALDSIVGIVMRRWQLRERAIELFLLSGHPQFIAFESTSDMEAFMVALNGVTLPNRLEEDTLSESMNHWRTGGITNWKYLMQLNGWAGRTYNDLMQYPVMPFILSDYVSDKLNLNQSTSFRDLKKPMAVQNKQKETHFISNYNYLKQARNDGTSFNTNTEPYHYGSHYSNSGTVLHFLVRVPPYTSLFLNYQDNNFDMPDRTFHSLQTTWRLTSCESTTDVKELIPEFFYLPEFLCNIEGLNFGVRQSGIAVNDVILPPWAPNSRIFVLIHRQSLESSHVRENLPHWIDLVFGHKQTGQAAVDAVNVFHPATYYGFNPGMITDEIERKAWETMVRTYGQTPRQLFKNSHPHCITDLGHLPENIMEVLPSVRGLRWGKYCGSPEEQIPTIIWQRHQAIAPQKLIPLPNNEVIGVPNQTTLTITYSKNRGSSLLGNDLVGCIGLVTWGHPDGIIRIKHKKELPFEPLFMIDRIDPLTVISHGVGDTTGILWIGLQSGNIIVVSVGFAKYASSVPKLSKESVYLYGHTSSIVSICVCNSFGVAASASQSGSVIIWDTQSLTYVRNIPNIYSTISNICISETLGDIATIHILPNIARTKKLSSETTPVPHGSYTEEPKVSESTPVYKSAIRVHTINGGFVGEVKIQEKVTSACYSNAPEGVSVNALVVGTQNGTIKLFSSWDLKLLLVLNPPSFTQPIISIVYSQNSQYLYAAATDGTITIWGDANTSEILPTFRMLTSHAIF